MANDRKHGRSLSDELSAPFIFVPRGDPAPTDWMAEHPGWVKYPAVMIPRDSPDHPDYQSPGTGHDNAVRNGSTNGAFDAQADSPVQIGADSQSRGYPTSFEHYSQEDPVAVFLRMNALFPTSPKVNAPATPTANGPSGRAVPRETDGLIAATDLRSDDSAIKETYAEAASRPTGVEVVLPDGSYIDDPKSPTGHVMSPVPDLSRVAEAGRKTGRMYQMLVENPNTAGSAFTFLGMELALNLGHGGTFDYQRKGNSIFGYTQFPQYQPISNINVGLFAQQAGLTLDETLFIAGKFAGLLSNNAKPAEPYGLDPRTGQFIKVGYKLGERGIFGRPVTP